jgi:uncharacterized metal-binding protein
MMEDSISSLKRKEIEKLYDPQSVEIMRTAEDAFERGVNRVLEIKNFARKAEIKRIGIASCVSFPKEADAVKQFLSDEFEVFNIDCKCGRIKRYELLGDASNSIMCNPAGQAEYLKENNTELNISMGLCVGHDMVFNRKSSAPVTVLLIKDHANRQNPMQSINNLNINDR